MNETNKCPVCGAYKNKEREFCMTCIDWKDKAARRDVEDRERKQIQARINKWGCI